MIKIDTNNEDVINAVEERVKEELSDRYNSEMLGYVHLFEKRKKEILEKEYGIKYKIITEELKGIFYD